MDDSKIIALYFARNEDAIAETDAAYGRKLFSLANNILRCCEDAQESVNDTYYKAWDTIPPQKPNYLFAYLSRICRNLSLGRLDWKQAKKRHAEVVALTEEMQLCIPDTRQEQEMQAKEIGRMLNDFLGTLPRDSRVIFLRRYWFADTIAEIAQRYGMSEGKVKTQLHRTRKKLADYLQKEGMRV